MNKQDAFALPKAGQIWNIMFKRHPDKINCQVIVQRVESGIVYAITLKKGIRMESTIAQWNEWTRTRGHILASTAPTALQCARAFIAVKGRK